MGSTQYSLEDVYGIGEIPPEDCPTYLERRVHKSFEYSVMHEKQHIVVYGASRQGKTWLVERYCHEFIRVGCDAKHTREKLFKSIMDELGITIAEITSTEMYEHGGKLVGKGTVEGSLPFVAKGKGELGGELIDKSQNSSQFKYHNVDLTNQTEVIRAISERIKNKFIVIENFHYLNAEEQKVFASSLREFLYHNIRVIIVGVWKEATKLASFASDLSDRCEYIDIGDWKREELFEVVRKGDKALNIQIDEKIIELFIVNSGYNIGIFKSLLKNFCKINGIYETQDKIQILDSIETANEALEKSYKEVILPALERVNKLASSKKSGGKGLRYFIVKAILELISEKDTEYLLDGIELKDIVEKIGNFEDADFHSSNIKQELMALHLREETTSSGNGISTNLIPLFYFDQGKGQGKLLIVESALLAAKKNKYIKLSDFLGLKEHYVK